MRRDAHQRTQEDPLPFSRGERQHAGIHDDRLRLWRADCRAFARDVCCVVPDKWQDLFFGAVSGPHIDPGAKRMLALKACKGPGKSFALAVAGWWWMFTRWHANGIALSITGDNLRDNLWAEFARVQQRSVLLTHFFNHRGERIEAKGYEKTWWISARSFPQNADKTQQANTLAGLHGRHPIVFCDEVGDYPDGVVVAAEAVLSSMVDGAPPDGRILLAGNPTSTDGPLFRVTKKDRERWWVYEITSDPTDPNRTPRVDPVWAQDQINTWGRDSDFVKINILGMFPSQQSNKLLGPDTVQEAQARPVPPGYDLEPLIYGIDVAGYGDNATVLAKRQGQMTWEPRMWRGENHMDIADQIHEEFLRDQPDAVFVDAGPVATGLIDRLRGLGVPLIGIDFGGSPLETRFENRRSEMHWKLAEWIKRSGGVLPNNPQLREELCAPTYSMKATGKITKLVLESKDAMRKRGVKSPDIADAFALTHSSPVAGRRKPSPVQAKIEARDARIFGGAEKQDVAGAYQGYSGKIIGGTEDSWNPFGGG